MVGAGQLHHRLIFQKREDGDDGHGNTVAGWRDQFRRPASFDYDRGNQTVMAARLEGRSIIRAAVRKDSSTRTITTDWRCRDARDGTVYAVIDVDAVTDRDFVWLRIESGVAT